MRIAEISVHGCPLRPLGKGDAGGMNLYVRQLSLELGRLGVEVDVFTRWHDHKEPEVMAVGDKTRLIHIAAGDKKDVPKTDIYHCLPQFISRLRCFLDKEGLAYDLLHSHYWLSAWAAEQLRAELRIPHVATFHTLGLVKNRARPEEQEPELRIETEKRVTAAADRIIAFTTEERAELISMYRALPDRVEVIPCGVDLELFHPVNKEKARSELGLTGQSKILLFAGRIQPFKRIDILLHAAARLNRSDLRLLILGGDSDGEVARLGALSSKLGIEQKVTFLGAVEHGRMPLFYSAADVCVVPSYHESFGLVALEALACGTPVVAFRVGGLVTIIKDGETGYLVEEPSPTAFAQRLELLLADEGLRQRMGNSARSSAMRYAWSQVARQVLRVYEELIGA